MRPPPRPLPSLALVTGGAGFVGHGVVRALCASGVEVVVLDPAPPHPRWPAGVRHIRRGLPEGLGEAADGEALPYVSEFRDWFVAALHRRDLRALLDYRRQAPHAARAHPSAEHLLPLYVALGAAGEKPSTTNPYRNYQLGSLALDAFVFGAETS